jgi:hypothetical protein
VNLNNCSKSFQKINHIQRENKMVEEKELGRPKIERKENYVVETKRQKFTLIEKVALGTFTTFTTSCLVDSLNLVGSLNSAEGLSIPGQMSLGLAMYGAGIFIGSILGREKDYKSHSPIKDERPDERYR